MKKELIVLFVEGDTDQIFFKALVDYYRKHSKQEIAMCDVVNLKGVTRYTSKLTGKIKNEYLPKAKAGNFEFSGSAPVDWKKVQSAQLAQREKRI